MRLYLEDIPDDLSRKLSAGAQKAGRSVNDEIIQILHAELERLYRRFQPIGFAGDSQRALALASDEARRLNNTYLGTEHILLSLMA